MAQKIIWACMVGRSTQGPSVSSYGEVRTWIPSGHMRRGRKRREFSGIKKKSLRLFFDWVIWCWNLFHTKNTSDRQNIRCFRTKKTFPGFLFHDGANLPKDSRLTKCPVLPVDSNEEAHWDLRSDNFLIASTKGCRRLLPLLRRLWRYWRTTQRAILFFLWIILRWKIFGLLCVC